MKRCEDCKFFSSEMVYFMNTPMEDNWCNHEKAVEHHPVRKSWNTSMSCKDARYEGKFCGPEAKEFIYNPPSKITKKGWFTKLNSIIRSLIIIDK